MPIAFFEKLSIIIVMAVLANFLPWIQIIISVLLVVVILFQQRGAGGLGGAFGGGESASFHTKRGFERILFISTIVLAVLFAATSLLALLI